MHHKPKFIEIFLQPGEYYFADQNTRIRTVLGSCIAITLWHPEEHIGGMCHFMLPTRNAEDIPNLDGRYGDEALLLLIREAVVQGTNPKDYQIKIFGGADMFPEVKKDHLMKIGIRNIDRVMTLLKAFHLPVAAQHVGGQGHRSVIFDVWSGHVWMKHERFNGAAA